MEYIYIYPYILYIHNIYIYIIYTYIIYKDCTFCTYVYNMCVYSMYYMSILQYTYMCIHGGLDYGSYKDPTCCFTGRLQKPWFAGASPAAR